jgi:hypothetical protein
MRRSCDVRSRSDYRCLIRRPCSRNGDCSRYDGVTRFVPNAREKTPGVRRTSDTAMIRMQKKAKGRRNFTLDDLLADAEPGLTERIARDLALEIRKYFSEVRSVSEARIFCTKRASAELGQRIEYATRGKDGADALRAMALVMRNYALERPGLSAACFRSLMRHGDKWPADDELAPALSGIFARLHLTGEQARCVLSAFRILAYGSALEEMTSSFSESLECERTYELVIDAFIRGLPRTM